MNVPFGVKLLVELMGKQVKFRKLQLIGGILL
jgi:hypothetical protein